MKLPVNPPLPPMLARLVRELPPRHLYEPKWDGFRCLAFCEDGEIDLRSRNDRPLARYFPELVDALRRLPDARVVLDGELVVPTSAGLDFTALLSRLHPALSRIDRLSRETPAWFIAFDVLARADEDLRDLPFAERRQRLERLFRGARAPLVLTPITTDVHVAQRWLDAGRGIDGVVAKDPSVAYRPGERALVRGGSGTSVPSTISRRWCGLRISARSSSIRSSPLARGSNGRRRSSSTSTPGRRPGSPIAAASRCACGPCSMAPASPASQKCPGPLGLHVLVPVSDGHSWEGTKAFARALARVLAAERPDEVVDRQQRRLRAGKVLVDWLQNDPTRSTVAPYSLRAEGWPTVSAPVTWEEVEAAATAGRDDSLVYEPRAALERLERLGELFRPVLELKQRLPAAVA